MLNEDIAYYRATCNPKTGNHDLYKNGEEKSRQRPKCKGPGSGNLVPPSPYTTV